MKTFSAASDDVVSAITRMQSAYHPEIADVTVGALFAFDDEETSEPVLTHHGYPSAAIVNITPLKQRALGVADAIILVDRAHWVTLTAGQRDALIDHELQHLDRVIAPETEEDPGGPRFDALNRPKLNMRRHDHQLGWFDDVARRHGESSPECRQARALLELTSQLYFDFGAGPLVPPPSAAPPAEKAKRGRRRGKAASEGDPANGATWSDDRQRFENADGSPVDGAIAGNGDTGQAPETAH